MSDDTEKKQRRRSRGDGVVCQRGRDRWEIRIDLGRDPASGRRLTRSKRINGSKRDALLELAKLKTGQEENTLLAPAKMTVGAYLETWLADRKHHVSAKTLERYEELIRNHAIPAIGALPLRQLQPIHLQNYYSAAQSTPRRRAKKAGGFVDYPPLSAQTVKHIHRVVSQALTQAVHLRLLPNNPAARVKPPRPVSKPMAIIDAPQTAELLKAAAGTPIYVPVLLAATLGLRRGECLALRWRNIDLAAAALSVAQTLEETRAGLRFKEPKTPRSRRTVSLPALTVEALRRHKARQAEAKLAAGARYADDDLVCAGLLGAPLSPYWVTDNFSNLVRRLKLPIHFHSLRHSHASRMLAAGVHPKVVSECLGHASISITLDIYSHLIPGMQEDAASRIDAALRAHMES